MSVGLDVLGEQDRPSAGTGKLSASTARWLVLLALALGITCRVAQYLADQSFWGDEASLVLNIRGKTAHELLGPLDYAQAAPPLFLLAERGLYNTLGGEEMALRALPFAFGISALLLFALLARRVLTPPWDALAVLCFALADRLIYHDTEVKPYVGDVFFCVLMLALATPGRVPKPTARRMMWTALVACIAVWFSFPSVIVFASVSLALFPEMLRRGARGFLQYVLLNLPVAASFGTLLLLTRSTQKNQILNEYWQDAFINLHRPLAVPWWLVRRLVALSDYAMPATGPVVFIAALVGAIALVARWASSVTRVSRLCEQHDDFESSRHSTNPTKKDAAGMGETSVSRSSSLSLFLIGPIIMALIPAALHRYPFDGARLTVFLTPCVVLLAMIGFGAMSDALLGRPKLLALLPLGYVIGVNVFWCGYHLAVPRTRGHLRPVAEFLRPRLKPDETLYVFDRQAFRCYWQPVNDPRLREILDRADEIPTRRFWIAWQFASPHGRIKPEPTLKWAREFCRQGEVMYGTGGAAVFFEREGNKLPARLEPPFGGIEVLQSHKKSLEHGEGK